MYDYPYQTIAYTYSFSFTYLRYYAYRCGMIKFIGERKQISFGGSGIHTIHMILILRFYFIIVKTHNVINNLRF